MHSQASIFTSLAAWIESGTGFFGEPFKCTQMKEYIF